MQAKNMFPVGLGGKRSRFTITIKVQIEAQDLASTVTIKERYNSLPKPHIQMKCFVYYGER